MNDNFEAERQKFTIDNLPDSINSNIQSAMRDIYDIVKTKREERFHRIIRTLKDKHSKQALRLALDNLDAHVKHIEYQPYNINLYDINLDDNSESYKVIIRWI